MMRKRLMTEINLASLKLKDNFQSNFYSEDFQDILISTLEQKYGGVYTSHRAARIIQLAYRQFRLKQKMNSTVFYERKPIHYRNNSMPDNLNRFDDDHSGTHSPDKCFRHHSSNVFSVPRNLLNSRIKDSLSLLLPELQVSSNPRPSLSDSSNTDTDNRMEDQVLFDSCHFKVGDALSTKCDEDLENFRNDSCKTDSTEDSDSSCDKVLPQFPDSSTALKLPPPMPVISTTILSTKSDKLKPKSILFSFDKSLESADQLKPGEDNNSARVGPSPRPTVYILSSTRSPRDSGVSSHSSNTDLLTFEYAGLGPPPDASRGHNTNCLFSQRLLSTTTASVAKATVNQSAAQIVYSERDSITEASIGPITEDADSLFDSLAAPIPSVMTSSKDSGVDADSGSALSNQHGHLRRMSFQDKPLYWKLFHHHSCFTGCVAQPTNKYTEKKVKGAKTDPSSPWHKQCMDQYESESNHKITQVEYRELVNRILYRVALNLFNRSTSIGLKFMENHKIFNVKCPIEIANFLRNREVNPQVLADFITSRDSLFHQQVLRCFLQNLSLENLNFLEAFDMFISSFKLPDNSTKINYLIAQFSQYYIRQIQRCPGCDIGALMGLSRVIVLLKVSVLRSRSISETSCVLSFSDFVKNIQNCFKGQQVIFSMEQLQKTYISITHSESDTSALADHIVKRITNIDDCKPKSGATSRSDKTPMSRGYLQQPYRRLTYCCDVQQVQSDRSGKKLKKNEHQRSIFVFNDTVVVAKRLSAMSPSQPKLFQTDARFQCKSIVNLLNSRVTKFISQGFPYQISISTQWERHQTENGSGHSYIFVLDSKENRDKLLSKLNMSQLECLCVEQLRLQQWNCCHINNTCMCLALIEPRLPKPETLDSEDL